MLEDREPKLVPIYSYKKIIVINSNTNNIIQHANKAHKMLKNDDPFFRTFLNI